MSIHYQFKKVQNFTSIQKVEDLACIMHSSVQILVCNVYFSITFNVKFILYIFAHILFSELVSFLFLLFLTSRNKKKEKKVEIGKFARKKRNVLWINLRWHFKFNLVLLICFPCFTFVNNSIT